MNGEAELMFKFNKQAEALAGIPEGGYRIRYAHGPVPVRTDKEVAGTRAEVVATFDCDYNPRRDPRPPKAGHPAAVAAECGAGRVFVFTCHPESDYDDRAVIEGAFRYVTRGREVRWRYPQRKPGQLAVGFVSDDVFGPETGRLVQRLVTQGEFDIIPANAKFVEKGALRHFDAVLVPPCAGDAESRKALDGANIEQARRFVARGGRVVAWGNAAERLENSGLEGVARVADGESAIAELRKFAAEPVCHGVSGIVPPAKVERPVRAAVFAGDGCPLGNIPQLLEFSPEYTVGVDTRKLDAWRRMQEEAANKARELEWRTKGGDMDVARRKMSKAAELMDELKRQLDIAADRNRNDIRKAQARDQYEEELSRRRDEALRQAVNAEKDARRKLEQAEATKEVKDAQREARLRNDNPETAEQALGESLPRQGEALAAAEAELAAREKARQEGLQARKERDDVARRSLAAQSADERREAQHHEARMAAMKAQNKALSAFEEAAKSEDENRSRQLRQQAADAVREAARQLEKSGVDPTLADAQEKSLAVAQAAVEEPSAGKVAEDVQRKTADALAAVDKAEQLESAAAAKELAESLERESNLPEDVLQGLERLKKSDPSPGQAASEMREAATAAREDAARKIEEAAAAAEQAGQLAENATRADAAGAEAAAQQTSSPQGMGEQGDRKQGEGEQGKGGQAQSDQEAAGESQGRPSASEKSAEAAEAMRKEAERQANSLGIPDGQGEGQSQSGESNPSEQQGESNPGESNSGEQNSGEPNSGEGKSGEGKEKTESQGGGGLSAEIARLIREQSSKADPAALSRILESQGWFRIKGAAKDGLGDGNLKDVPAEYRDLVRAYFLKLSEEK